MQCEFNASFWRVATHKLRRRPSPREEESEEEKNRRIDCEDDDMEKVSLIIEYARKILNINLSAFCPHRRAWNACGLDVGGYYYLYAIMKETRHELKVQFASFVRAN